MKKKISWDLGRCCLLICCMALAPTFPKAQSKDVEARKSHAIACKMPGRAAALGSIVAKNGAPVVPANRCSKDHSGMVFLKGGAFDMGSEEFDDAKPVHKVIVKDFWMDAHEVSNRAFGAFVKATGYKTVAERPVDAKDFPGVPKEKLVPGSAVFTPTGQKVDFSDPLQWWDYKPGADWKHPLGKGSDLKGKADCPVVQVCYEDALAYCKWAGKRLPTEAEWEYAARAGRKPSAYYWGKELLPGGKWMANIYQGDFPVRDEAKDGHAGIAPVGSYPPNPWGIYDMEGNVWEWCHDRYRPDYYAHSPVLDPKGPADSYDPDEPNAVKHVQRGGSFLCSDEYCVRYKPGSRGKGETGSAANHIGFRCAKDK